MDRIYASGAAGSAPSVPASPSSGYPTAGNPGTGTPATKPGPYWYHMVMEELMAIITAGGITPAPGTLNQVKQALDALYMPVTASVGAAVQGVFKKLKLSATGTSANVSISCDEIVVEDAGNAYKTLRNLNLTVAGVSSGVANGLDTGVLAASTWYSVWVIYNGTTTAGLLSLSATAPTMPSGYTHKARVGWIRTDGTANKYPLSFKQSGRDVQYVVSAGSNVTAYPQMASGTPAFPTAVAVANFIPSTADMFKACLYCGGNATNNGSVALAPNNLTSNTTANPTAITSNVGNYAPNMSLGEIILESANVYWGVIGGSNPGASALAAFGWRDNL